MTEKTVPCWHEFVVLHGVTQRGMFGKLWGLACWRSLSANHCFSCCQSSLKHVFQKWIGQVFYEGEPIERKLLKSLTVLPLASTVPAGVSAADLLRS